MMSLKRERTSGFPSGGELLPEGCSAKAHKSISSEPRTAKVQSPKGRVLIGSSKGAVVTIKSTPSSLIKYLKNQSESRNDR